LPLIFEDESLVGDARSFVVKYESLGFDARFLVIDAQRLGVTAQSLGVKDQPLVFILSKGFFQQGKRSFSTADGGFRKNLGKGSALFMTGSRRRIKPRGTK
jgi:hypothetical protein